MNQKGFANMVLIIVIVVLVGAVGYFASVKKSPPISQQLTPTSTQTKNPISPTPAPKNETANWKIYSNSVYGFEFRYPINWYPYPNQHPKEISILLLKSEKLPNIEGTEGYAMGNQIIINAGDLVTPQGKKVSKEEYLQDRFNEHNIQEFSIVKNWVTINGLEMLKVEQLGAGVGYHTLQYLYFKNEKIYSFYLYPYEPTQGPEWAKDYEDFEKLVSTFSFL